MTEPDSRNGGEAAIKAEFEGGRGQLVIVGLGYTGRAIAELARDSGWRVVATSRNPEAVDPVGGVEVIAFEQAPAAIAGATHILQTAPPGAEGDPALRRHGSALAAAAHLRWAGLLSTTGVYGDRGGGSVDEDTEPAPTGPRGRRRFETERQWAEAFAGRAVDVFRVGGIYGAGRSPFDDVRAGRARRVDRPGHLFGRIHRDDIAAAVVAAMGQDRPPGVRVLNLVDDEPTEQARVVEEAARLLGAPLPPLVPFATALAAMSELGRSFWAENRRVASQKTKAELGLRWRYPSYREGLRAILEQEGRERAAK